MNFVSSLTSFHSRISPSQPSPLASHDPSARPDRPSLRVRLPSRSRNPSECCAHNLPTHIYPLLHELMGLPKPRWSVQRSAWSELTFSPPSCSVNHYVLPYPHVLRLEHSTPVSAPTPLYSPPPTPDRTSPSPHLKYLRTAPPTNYLLSSAPAPPRSLTFRS